VYVASAYRPTREPCPSRVYCSPIEQRILYTVRCTYTAVPHRCTDTEGVRVLSVVRVTDVTPNNNTRIEVESRMWCTVLTVDT